MKSRILKLERVSICPVIIPLHVKQWLVQRYIPRSSTKDVIWFNNNSEMFRKWVFLPWKNKAILGAMVISDQTPSCGLLYRTRQIQAELITLFTVNTVVTYKIISKNDLLAWLCTKSVCSVCFSAVSHFRCLCNVPKNRRFVILHHSRSWKH